MQEKFAKFLSAVISAESDILILRIGLGLTLIYASFDIFRDPTSWIDFVPTWIEYLIPRERFLMGHALGDLVIGLGLLNNFKRMLLPLFAVLAFFNFFAILIFYGIDAITFRDFGLSGAALALFVRALQTRPVAEQPVVKNTPN